MSVELPTTIEGTVLNYRYQVEQVFNDKGGMGLIYQATDLNLRSTVVLKKSRFVDEQSRSAFEREARLLYGLRHNALPRVIDYFITEDSSQFFVMEFIPGQDLSEMLSDRIERGEGPFPINQVLDWGDQLLDALHYLHMHTPPIIHRDIKPQNLKLMPNGQVILLDFGLAKGAVSGMTLGSASIQGYTPNYAPLEQMRGSGTDARSDIYSLAVTMHCLLSGQMPPDAVSRAIETLSAQPDPLRPLHELSPGFPAPVSEALQRACSLNQNERPATAQDMREVLRQARVKMSRIDSQILTELKFDTNPKPLAAPVTTNNTPLNGAAKVPNGQPVPAVKSGHNPVAPVVAQPSVHVKSGAPGAVAQPSVHVKSGAPGVVAQPSVHVKSGAPTPLTDLAGAIEARSKSGEAAKPFQAPSLAPSAAVSPAPTPADAQPESSPFDTVFTLPPADNAEADGQRFDTVVGYQPDEAAPERQRFDTVSNYPPEEERQRFDTLVGEPPAAEAAAPSVTEELPARATPAPSDALRPTSLFVIEHKDDGKQVLEKAAQARTEPRQEPRQETWQEWLPPANPAPAPAEAQPAPPAAPRPKQLNVAPAQAQRPQPSALQKRLAPFADQPSSLRREAPLAHEVEKPSQGDVLPNIEMTGMIATPNPAAVSPKGMRSYTEVIALNVRMEMHAIPGGEFLMGSPDKRGYADEYPQHRVTLSPFYIGKYPITQAQWRAVMRTSPSHFTGPNHPVDSITWDEAVEFCRRLSYATSRLYRLPSEAEWEFACRAGMPTQFNYGDEEEFLVQYAWCLTNSGNHTHPVGEKKPNGWGLYDMHGNVWEWCHDWYAADYYQQNANVNPFGPTKGTSRVLRGGSWYSLPNYCRNAGRSNHQPDLRDPLVGFRVVCEARNA